MHERGDGVEGVEKKMRVQLHLQRLQFCLCQAFLQFHGAQFALAEFPRIVKRETDRDNYPVNEQVEKPRFDQERLERLREAGLALPASDPGPQHHVSQRKEQASGKMNRQTARAVSRFKVEPPRQPDGRDGQGRENVPVPQSIVDSLRPRHFQAGLGAGNVKLKRERQPQERPKAKPQEPFHPPPPQSVIDCHASNC